MISSQKMPPVVISCILLVSKNVTWEWGGGVDKESNEK